MNEDKIKLLIETLKSLDISVNYKERNLIIKKLLEEFSIKQEDVFKEKGLAVFIKGKMVFGIHPDNLENNLEKLSKGNMKFDFAAMAKNAGVSFSMY